ncbi:MAG TPA: cupin domain-containing protein [Burkholderiales bacterium]|nr:cupin domain-containing protein [Burkholderiales bacterium]
MKKSFLAGLTHGEFLHRHWQKRPLLACKALAEHAGAIDREHLFELAGREAIESRIVVRARGGWRVRHGPFTRRDIDRLPRNGWTLLVQGVDTALRAASRLTRAFSFIPYARLDDVMVSYAAPGGGVGPHFDSYDVFLVQGAGRRRWRIGRQPDLTLVPNTPLKILARFAPDREWTLGPGDVLYLPPLWAHDGVALDECITYSVGFRAPTAQELGSRFLDFLQDHLALKGRYADPDVRPTRAPGRIPTDLVARGAAMLEALRWSRSDVAEFLGRYLSEPKPNIVFERPRRPLSAAVFGARAAAAGLRLALPTRMLFDERTVFVNGEAAALPRRGRKVLVRLANDRAVAPPLVIDRAARDLLYAWYLAGYIAFGSADT